MRGRRNEGREREEGGMRGRRDEGREREFVVSLMLDC